MELVKINPIWKYIPAFSGANIRTVDGIICAENIITKNRNDLSGSFLPSRYRIIMKISDLKKLETESLERGIPIIGSKKGFWLLEKIKKLKPKKILELGTANGYSGIILGSENGKLTTIEIDPKIAEEAKNNFKRFKIKNRIIVGEANKEILKLKEKFDIIFIDHTKKGYIKVLENCIKLLNENGVIIADNINFEGCFDFKKMVLNHPNLETEIINIEDGLSFSREKQRKE